MLLILTSKESKKEENPTFHLPWISLLTSPFQLNNGLMKCSYHWICQAKKVKSTTQKHYSIHVGSKALFLTQWRLEHAPFLLTGANGLYVRGIHKPPEIIFVVTSIKPQP